MKKFLALVLALVMTMSLVTVGASAKTDFTDDAKITNEEAVEVLNAMGVLTGYADGSFRPQGVLTRGAGAKIIAYLMLGQAKADKLQATYTVFEDVTDTVGLAAYIEWAAAKGIVDGYGDGTFGPYNQLTEYAFGKMLLTALGYVSAEEGYTGAGWQKNVYADALASGIYDGTESWGACNRETAARMALGALKADIVVYGKLSNLWVDWSDAYAPVSAQTDWADKIIKNVGVITVEGAIASGVALWETYAGLKYTSYIEDKFDRPGHAWAYKTFDKFYMDAPVAEYTDKVSACDILVDLGIAKTSNKKIVVENYSINGFDGQNYVGVDHKSCKDAYVGGKGTLTQVFEGQDGYIVTVINTFLAKVTYVDAAAHGKDLDESNIEVYGINRDEAFTVCLEGVLLTKGDYLLVQHGQNDANTWLAADDYLSYTNAAIFGYTNIVGKAESFEGKMTAKTQAPAFTLVVGGKSYAAAQEYNHSYLHVDVAKLPTGNAVWFLDQYGNIIGDFAPASALPVFGVLDAMKWVNDGIVNTAEYASANLVKPDASQSVVVVDTWGAEALVGCDDSYNMSIPAEVSEVQAINGIAKNHTGYFAKEMNYGVVSYTIGADGNYDVATAGTVTDATAITKGKSVITNGVTEWACDDNTVYLIRTVDANGKLVYTSVKGYNNVTSMTNLTNIVVCYDGTDAYVDFAFVIADNAIYAGSTTEVYVTSKAWTKVENNVYFYNVWVNGVKTEITSKVDNLFTSVTDTEECNIFVVTFDSNGVAKSAAEATGYTHDVVVAYVGNNVINVLNTTAAKVYEVSASAVTAVEASTIAVGDTICYTVDKDANYVLDTVYVIAKAGNDNDIHKPII